MGYLILSKKVGLGSVPDWSNAVQQGKFVPTNTGNLYFGNSVALSGNGDIAIVGAYNDDPSGQTNAGSVEIWRRVSGVWSREVQIVSPVLQSYGGFGSSVDINGAGDVIVVGEYAHDESGNVNVGAAYIFRYDGSNWQYEAQLLASDRAGAAEFGWSVAINSSGNRVVVGARGADKAYVYDYSGAVWSETQKLVASTGSSGDFFGHSVDIEKNGGTIVIGASYQGGSNEGAVYVYDYSGAVWSETQKLVASIPGSSNHFGESVSIDGARIVVGEPGADLTTFNQGRVRVFELSSGVWNETANFTINNPTTNDYFGGSVVLYGDLIVVSAKNHDDNGISNTGQVSVYRYSNGSWNLVKQLIQTDEAADDRMGHSINISRDGRTIISGAIGKNSYQGAAYIFTV